MEKFNYLYTEEGNSLPEIPWNAYPRPQLKRDSFFCLNGSWDFLSLSKEVFLKKTLPSPQSFKEKILVPFSPESLLSGINRVFNENETLFYKKIFSLPNGFIRDRVILHFGAADQKATVYLNGKEIGTNVGGYNHFSFDITEQMMAENELLVRIEDTLSKKLPYGKQSKKRGGMWYTPTSGIWQSVWIESVPKAHIKAISYTVKGNIAKITVEGISSGQVIFEDKTLPLTDGACEYTPDKIEFWSPEDPKLYYFTVEGKEDRAESYLAFRSLETKIINGIPRLLLNGEPYFFNGVLDQGYYSDGLLTPADPKCFEKDILLMKEAGFNMLRKHIKVEPEQFYYDCDRLGMVVFQDMINNGDYSFFRDTALPTAGLQKIPDRFLHRDRETRKHFEDALVYTVTSLKNHPSICLWTIFNEGWGQFDSDRMYEKLKALDDTRFIDSTSGWFRQRRSDVESLHIYFKKLKVKKSKRPIFISEFGGYALSIKEHSFNPNNEYGYKKFKDTEALSGAVCRLFEKELLPLIKEGVCASVYTQLSDVEDETNGLVTYDRRIKKFDSRLKEVCLRLYEEIKK